MRLSLFEIENIIKLKDKYFGKQAKVYLFGSRVDDNKKGGDIDLFIEKCYSNNNSYELKKQFIAELEKIIGLQKIDLIISIDKNRLIEIEAKKGIELNIDKIKLQKYFNECDKHLKRMEQAYCQIKDILPLSSIKYENLDDEEVKNIDQFLFRFSKLQDTLGNKIFKLILKQYEPDFEGLTFIDFLNLLEKKNILEKADDWIELRKVRNNIAHQYDDEPIEMSKAINEIFASLDMIKQIYLKTKEKNEENA
jgi:predicted nucleotidyltransferase